MTMPACPKCKGTFTYEDGHMYICPECFHEWTLQSMLDEEEAKAVKDINGNLLSDGDSVTTIKDLKVGNDTMKQGTRVKNIRILETEVDGHNLLAKIPGFGEVYLKGSVVKK